MKITMRSLFFSRGGGGDQQPRTTPNNASSNNTSRLKVWIDKGCLSALSTLESDDESEVFSSNERVVTRKYSYLKLTQQLFKLNVRKLDGSSFDVNVGRNATVAELKQAVEEIFTFSPQKDGGENNTISWSHVWGHFCLCYENQKLINDKACIRNLGIKDGDQLQFIRHMSINYSGSRHRNQNVARKLLLPPASGETHEEKAQTTEDHTDTNKDEDYSSDYHNEDDQEEIPMVQEFKLSNFLKGWLSYNRLWGTNTTSRRVSPVQNRLSRFSLQCLTRQSHDFKKASRLTAATEIELMKLGSEEQDWMLTK